MYNINLITFQVVKNNNSSLLTGLPLKWVHIKYDQHFLIQEQKKKLISQADTLINNKCITQVHYIE
jgi:hypothetical protein